MGWKRWFSREASSTISSETVQESVGINDITMLAIYMCYSIPSLC
jgi:hypothetical protein